jgi:hypothetical protein
MRCRRFFSLKLHIQRPLLLFSSWLSIPEDIFKSLPSCIFGYSSHLFIDYVSLEIDFILAFSLASTMKIEVLFFWCVEVAGYD